jgi:hypothetical protein
MRVLASLSTVAVTTLILASCGLDVGGLGDVGSTEGGPTLDSSATAEGGSSSGSSGGSSSGSDDGPGGDGTTGDSSDSTAPPQDSSATETGSPVDSSVPDTYVVETGPPACTAAVNCYVIPTGWQLVAFTTGATAPTASCPNGFAMAQPTNLDEGPITSSVCTCAACQVSQQPTCPTGPIGVSYDVQNLPGSGQCGSTGNPSTQKNASAGNCNTDMYTGGIPGISYSNMDLKYTPPAGTGGACGSAGMATGSAGYAAQDRTCVPDSQAAAGCTGNQCTLTLAPPYQVCVFQSGSQTCPGTTFTHAHTAGSTATFTCSSCGCNVNTTCAGTMKLFTSNDCSTSGGAKEDDIAADGACHSANTQTGQYNSYEYDPKAPGVSCTTTGASTAQNVTLQNEETICCTQ